MEEDDQDIYDDGTSITNKSSVGRIKSMFEPAVQGPKPSVPSKPRVKPSPPKRNDDTKVISNGDVKLPPKDNITPMRNIAEITNRNTDENSNVKNGSDIKLNSELVSKFNNMNNITGSDTNVNSKPPWEKSRPTEISPKPVRRAVEKPPIEEFSNRIKMFEHSKDDNETTSGKSENHKPQILNNDIKHGIAESKAVIAGKLIQKLPMANKTENKYSPTANKTDNNQPPATPIKPSPMPQIKPKFSASSSPVSPVNGPNGELMRAIQKRKESMINDSTSEKINEELQLGKRKRTKSVKRKSLTRLVDGKKFFVVEINDSVVEDKPPTKPPKIPNIDVDKIVSEYKKKFSSPEEKEEPLPQGYIEEDIYEELPDDSADFPPPPLPDVFVRPVSDIARAISIIQPMTEEDENDADEIYDDGITPITNDTPVPVIPAVPVVPERIPRRGNLPDEPLPEQPTTPFPGKETSNIMDPEDDGELYEPLDEIVMEVRNMDKEKEKIASVIENKVEQESDKDRKKREKEEKRKLEQEKKKAKDLKSKFKIDISELEPENTKGAGIIKQDAKGKGKDLTVKKNQRVIIICMDKRVQKGKWLVKLEDDEDALGYVDSNNVEVDNTLIRSVMDGTYIKKSSFSSMPEEQEEYEAIEPEQDDVYAEAM